MIREMTNNGNNTRRPLCYLTARLSYAWTQRRTVTDKEGETDRETDRGTRGTEWDPICNTKPSKAAVVDDCHARITGRSGLNRAGPGRAGPSMPTSAPRLQITSPRARPSDGISIAISPAPAAAVVVSAIPPQKGPGRRGPKLRQPGRTGTYTARRAANKDDCGRDVDDRCRLVEINTCRE